MKIRMGTRASALARIQTGQVAQQLRDLGHEIEIIHIDTIGDQVRDRPFAQVGAAGIFVKALEDALLERRVDLAVHSYKDLPSVSPDPLVVAAVPERRDSADQLLVPKARLASDMGLFPLKQGACVGTASARRSALLRHYRSDLTVKMLRGNLPTRVRKLQEGQYDAILLAAAGLDRFATAPAEFGGDLNLEGLELVRLDPEVYVPAPSQGAIAIQVRGDEPGVMEAVGALNDPGAQRAVQAERVLLALVEGGCQLPFGAYCQTLADGRLDLVAMIEREVDAAPQMLRERQQGDDPDHLARGIWNVFQERLD